MEEAREAAGAAETGGGLSRVPLVHLVQAAVAVAMLVGYLSTASFFPGHLGREYALLSLVSVAASAFFVATSMRSSPAQILRVMVLVVFLVGYYGQFYWLLADPTVEVDLAEVMAASLHPEAMLDAFREIAVSFAGLAVLFAVLDRVPWRQREAPRVEPDDARRIGRAAVLIALPVLAIVLPVMALEGIGVMAAKGPELPYRIGGWMVYSLRVLVPGLFLLAVAMGEKVEKSRLLAAAILGLVLAGVGDMLVTTSKASLVLAFVRLLLLLQISGRLTRPRLQLAGAGLLAVALLFPFFGALRMARVQGLSATEAVREAREDRGRQNDSLLAAVRPAVLRVSGTNTLLPLVSLDPIPAVAVAGFVTPVGIAAYITVVVYGHAPGAPAAEAPGLLGWFHLAMGKDFMAVGVLLLILLLELIWRITWVLPLVSRDVVLALLATQFLVIITDGVIESTGLPFLVIAGTAVAVETVARLGIVAGRWVRPGQGSGTA